MGFQTLIFLINDNNQYYSTILPIVIYKLKKKTIVLRVRLGTVYLVKIEIYLLKIL